MFFIVVWFVMTAPGRGVVEPSYIKPQDVQLADMQCGLPGAVTGVHVDSPVNPKTVTWPDPFFDGVHCSVDISARVATLLPGEYHISTTIVGPVVPFGVPVPRVTQHDPHITATWRRDVGSIGQLRVTP